MVLFPDPDARTARSDAYKAAAVGAEIVSAVAGLNPAALAVVEKAWVSEIARRLPVTPSEQLRLTARLRWSKGAPLSAARIRKGLAEAAPADRLAVASAAASAVAAGGAVAQEQVAMLEKVYDGLGMPRTDLYSAVHGASARAMEQMRPPVPRPSPAQEPPSTTIQN